jgi:hypothetical protein
VARGALITKLCCAKIATIRQSLANIRFTPKADKVAGISVCPLCANCDLTHCSKRDGYSIVGAQQGGRNREAEHRGGLDVDDRLELTRIEAHEERIGPLTVSPR